MALIHAHAIVGSNSARFGLDEEGDDGAAPAKAERVVSVERAAQVLVAARQIATLFRTPRCRIMAKRKGGEDGRALRRFLIFYARGLGAPVWECAEIFDLNRKQIGQEEEAYLAMLSRCAELEEDADQIAAMCDAAIRVRTGQFLAVSLGAIQADAASRKAIKLVREASERLAPKRAHELEERLREIASEAEVADIMAEAAAELQCAPAAKSKQSTAPPKPASAAASAQAAANARHRGERLAQAARILDAVIAKGEAPGATKEQARDAAKARTARLELAAARR